MPRGSIELTIAAVIAVLGVTYFSVDNSREREVAALPDAPKKDIIDLHFHGVCMNPDNGCYVSQAMKDKYFGIKFNGYTKAYGLTEEDVEQQRDYKTIDFSHNLIKESKYISQAVILALDGVYDEKGELDKELTQVLVSNDFVAQQTARYDNLLFAASVNPQRKDALQELEKVKKAGAVFVKWLPCTMLFDPSDEKYLPFYDKLVELDLPLLAHVGPEDSFDNARDEYCDPPLLEPALKKGVKIIAAHIGSRGEYEGEWVYDRLMRLEKKYPNLYTDTSATLIVNRPTDFYKSIPLNNKMLYGSDFPLVAYELWGWRLQNERRFFHLINFEWQKYIEGLENPLDKDVALKKALGLPEESFYASKRLLGL